MVRLKLRNALFESALYWAQELLKDHLILIKLTSGMEMKKE